MDLQIRWRVWSGSWTAGLFRPVVICIIDLSAKFARLKVQIPHFYRKGTTTNQSERFICLEVLQLVFLPWCQLDAVIILCLYSLTFVIIFKVKIKPVRKLVASPDDGVLGVTQRNFWKSTNGLALSDDVKNRNNIWLWAGRGGGSVYPCLVNKLFILDN